VRGNGQRQQREGRIAGAALLLVAVLVALAGPLACERAQPQLSIENARAEMSPAFYGEGIVYLKIVNLGGPDTLIGVKTTIPGAVADVHAMRGDVMVLAKSLPVPARNTVDLAPMGSHIMIENMPKTVKEGTGFALTLLFQRSGPIEVPLTFLKAQPMMHDHQHHDE
jgi:copper(I)-binding protein